jgi:hypothetical protein
MAHDHLAPVTARAGTDVSVPVENLAGVAFEYSPDRRRLRVRLPVESGGVVLDLSRAAVLDLVDKVSARAAGMADPVIPAQQCRPWPAMVCDREQRR